MDDVNRVFTGKHHGMDRQGRPVFWGLTGRNLVSKVREKEGAGAHEWRRQEMDWSIISFELSVAPAELQRTCDQGVIAEGDGAHVWKKSKHVEEKHTSGKKHTCGKKAHVWKKSTRVEKSTRLQLSQGRSGTNQKRSWHQHTCTSQGESGRIRVIKHTFRAEAGIERSWTVADNRAGNSLFGQ